jgi:hypothetical protein
MAVSLRLATFSSNLPVEDTKADFAKCISEVVRLVLPSNPAAA